MYTVIFFIIGLFVGSFLGVLVSRLHSNEKGIFLGRSHCDHCQHKLTQLDLIPVLSWVFLGGKCRKCKKAISIEHPIAEILTGAIWGLTAYFTAFNSLLLAWSLAVVTILWFLAVYDFKYKLIPLHGGIIIIFFVLSFFADKNLPIPETKDALIGLLIPVGLFGLQYPLKYVYKRDVIGLGDFYLGAFMGIVLGWQKVIVALFLAYFIGAFFSPIIIYLNKKGSKSEVPFGPFLVLGALIALFWGKFFVNFWLDIVGL